MRDRGDRLRNLVMSAIRSMLSVEPNYVNQPTFLAARALRLAVEVDNLICEAMEEDEVLQMKKQIMDMSSNHAAEVMELRKKIDELKKGEKR